MSVHVRGACWLVSAGLHIVAFAATGHPSSRPSAVAQRDSLELLAIDVAPEPMPAEIDPPAAPATSRSASFVAMHTHPYPVPVDHDAHPHDPSLVHLPIAPPAQAPAEPTLVAPLEPARFAMIVASNTSLGPAATTAAGVTQSPRDPQPGSDGLPLPEDGVSSPARLATPMSVAYPMEARRQEVEADVVLAIVVASTGQVVDASVLRAAGFGFDQEALRAVRAARFVPAQREGRRVAVRMRWSVSFRLR